MTEISHNDFQLVILLQTILIIAIAFESKNKKELAEVRTVVIVKRNNRH